MIEQWMESLSSQSFERWRLGAGKDAMASESGRRRAGWPAGLEKRQRVRGPGHSSAATAFVSVYISIAS